MKTKKVNYRHGDLALIGIDTLPNNLKKSENDIIYEGKTSAHTFKNGYFYPQVKGIVIGYLEANKTILLHPEHGKVVKGSSLREAEIKDGFYEIRVQQEFTHDEMKQVVD